jgi:hypothetical protein
LNLRPCPYRLVDDEGHILCDKIKTGDREVSPNICRACPVSAINCAHLRATLDHQARPPLTVRYGNGKTEIWDDLAPAINLHTAACAAKVVPIHSPRDCAACPIRQPLVLAEAIQTPAIRPQIADSKRPSVRRAPHPAPAPIAVAAQPALAADARSSLVAQKIIQLQEWLAGHKTKPLEDENAGMPIAVGARPARVPAEEKRVGWTD